jgi:hydroxymethylpyrimidine/phosphomethylpyrimidine kinase
MYPRALSIAGSDSSGGAGIQADLKTFTVLDVYGMTAITALTAQDTRGIKEILPVPAELVLQQIEVVLEDIGCDAAKTGMLLTAEIVVMVARALADHRVERLVIDPVLVAGDGTPLAQHDLPHALLTELIPHALLVTPNISEATVLTGIEIRQVADMHAAASKLIDAGARGCLVKGGHLKSGPAIDVLMVGQSARELTSDRLSVAHTHGTGCQLSAAVTGFLAHGLSLDDAVDRGKAFISKAIAAGLAIGHGSGPANPLAWKK